MFNMSITNAKKMLSYSTSTITFMHYYAEADR